MCTWHFWLSTFSPQTKLCLLDFDLEAKFSTGPHFTLILHTVKYLIVEHSACDRRKNMGKDTDNPFFPSSGTGLNRVFFLTSIPSLFLKGKTISTLWDPTGHMLIQVTKKVY